MCQTCDQKATKHRLLNGTGETAKYFQEVISDGAHRIFGQGEVYCDGNQLPEILILDALS